MTTLADLLVALGVDTSEYYKGLDGAEKKARDSAGGITQSLSAIGGQALVAGIGGVVAAVGAIGTTAWISAHTVDEAYDAIRIATGEGGLALERLRDSFDEVFASVPTDAATAAGALGELNSRLGLTGDDLEELTKQLLEMSRLLGGDATVNAGLFSRVMGDWGVPVDDASVLMDKMFKATQESGVGIESLMQRVVQFGSPLRLMGFTLEDSIALFAKWEKEGVNAELVMGSLRIAAGKFASDGVPLRESLLATFESIQNMEDASEALALGMDVFGARAGPDMTAAIREGRFAIDDLVEAMAGAEGTIMQTGVATMDWGEQWQMIKNQATLALAPLGDVFMGLASTLLELLQPAIPLLVEFGTKLAEMAQGAVDKLPAMLEWIQNAFGWLMDNKGVIVGVVAAIGVAIGAFVYTTVIPAAISMITALAPVIAVMALVAGAAYLIYTAWENDWGGIRTTLTTWWEETGKPIFEVVRAWLSENIPLALAKLKEWWDNTVSAIQGTLARLREAWDNDFMGIRSAVEGAWKFIHAIWAAFQAAFEGDWYAFGEHLREAWLILWRTIIDVMTQRWEDIKRIAGEIVQSVVDWFTNTDWKQVGTNIVAGIVEGLKAGWGWLTDTASNLAKAALEAAKGFLGIKSRSQKMYDQVGLNMGLGVTEGWEDSLQRLAENMPATFAPVVSGASRATPALREAGMGGLRANSGGGGRQVVVNFNAPVMGFENQYELAQSIANALRNEGVL